MIRHLVVAVVLAVLLPLAIEGVSAAGDLSEVQIGELSSTVPHRGRSQVRHAAAPRTVHLPLDLFFRRTRAGYRNRRNGRRGGNEKKRFT